MRTLPKTRADITYMAQKIGISFFRGLLRYPFLASKSKVPFIGRNVIMLIPNRLRVGKFVWLGHGCYLDLYSCDVNFIGSGTTIREYSVIQCRSGLNSAGKGFSIGEGVFIGPFAKIGVGGPVSIGANCQIGAYFSINAESHAENLGSYTSGSVMRKGVKIGSNVWIGDKVTILDGVEIGDNCVIGAGAVVTKSFLEKGVIVGVPAKMKIMR